MSILIQKRHPYTGNLNSEMPGDSQHAFLHWGDVLGESCSCAFFVSVDLFYCHFHVCLHAEVHIYVH